LKNLRQNKRFARRVFFFGGGGGGKGGGGGWGGGGGGIGERGPNTFQRVIWRAPMHKHLLKHWE